ncbi:RNA polymerase II-associated protein 3 [Phytophthora citrophthora]|uniref:RNA polymerase II-associated protein 3 n=1 Tax=Phytophthora citrophthora TaxID=4793 RepID=A0AAD9GNL8_9STRA|nr:RNA polymerase II-associated protein 3 [Phytophthora citrophthora]
MGKDAALKEADDEEDAKHEVLEATTSVQSSDLNSRGMATTKVSSSVASKSREELEKEEGNAHYKRGDYVAAIKSYTRCLGYSPQNAVVLSNRAMAYLKNREFANAEDDCTLALKADPTHIKSYSRRGTARNSLGKHRLALLDFHRAATLDPKSRQIQAQLQSTRELVRTAIKRSPKRTEFSIEVVGEPALDKGPTPEEKKENVKSLQQVQSSSDTKQKPAIQESVSDPLPTSKAATVESTAVKKKQSSGILPKLPKMVPVTSYEFNRVWKSLALRGDADQKSALLNLRAEYLRMMNPSTLHTVFKTGMESDVLCEIFHVLREVVLGATEVEKEDNQLALAFSSELTKIPRFNMTIMLLSASEKKDMAWVINHLEADGNIANLKKLYDLS